MELDPRHAKRCNEHLDASWKRYFHPATPRDLAMKTRFDFIVEHAGEAPVIDIGCAEGLTCFLLAQAGLTPIIGVDVSDRVIERARRLTPRAGVHFHVAWAEQLPLLTEEFATVIMTETREHVLDAALAAQEADRILQRGGRLVVSVPFKGKVSALHLRSFHSESDVTSLFPSSYEWREFRVIEHPPKPKAWLVGYCDKG